MEQLQFEVPPATLDQLRAMVTASHDRDDVVLPGYDDTPLPRRSLFNLIGALVTNISGLSLVMLIFSILFVALFWILRLPVTAVFQALGLNTAKLKDTNVIVVLLVMGIIVSLLPAALLKSYLSGLCKRTAARRIDAKIRTLRRKTGVDLEAAKSAITGAKQPDRAIRGFGANASNR